MFHELAAFYRRFNAWHSMLFCLLVLAAAGVVRFGINETPPQLLAAIAAALAIELPAVKLRFNKIARRCDHRAAFCQPTPHPQGEACGLACANRNPNLKYPFLQAIAFIWVYRLLRKKKARSCDTGTDEM